MAGGLDAAGLPQGPAATWSGAAIDSRRIAGGELFFALPGEHADGHDFAAAAVQRGAAAAVVQRDDVDLGGGARIRVADTYEALHALTRAVRSEVPERLVGITGSAGKTTTKELLAAMLGRRYRVAKSPGNFNNLLGFPMALLGIPDDCQWMVAEMGMSTPGELAQVSRLGRPDVALFTNVRAVHLENFSGLDAIADAKSELLAGLSQGGLVVANADDPRVMSIASRYLERAEGGRVVTFGFGAGADVRASSVAPLADRGGDWRPGSRFQIEAAGERRTIELPIHGSYNVENCLAAAACAHALGVPLAEIAAAAADFSPSSMRGEIHRLEDGPTVIDDSYNSNPDAAAKALASARQLPASRHVAVLGDMLELGPDEGDFHREVGRGAAELGFAHVVAVGALSEALASGTAAAGGRATALPDAAAAADWLRSPEGLEGGPLGRGDLVLVKGSRGVGLEVAVRALLDAEPVDSEPVDAHSSQSADGVGGVG